LYIIFQRNTDVSSPVFIRHAEPDEREKKMEQNEEFLDVVSEGGKTVRSLPRSEIHGNPSFIHKVVHVLVFNSRGELLLQKRSMNKTVAPGKWDTSVGGHVNAGETLEEALHREMEEELGLKECRPEFLYSYIHSNPYETELVYTYSCSYTGRIVFNRNEIDQVQAWDFGDIRRNIGKGIFSDNFEHEFRKYLEYKGSRIQGVRDSRK
jgi:isopentenyldiphosphate isomerase